MCGAHVNSFSYLLWAAAHFARQVQEHLTATYHDLCIGRDEPINLPPLSADVTPMDFFPWGHIKALIYKSPVDSEEKFTACIVEAAATIRQQPGIFEQTHQSLLRRRHTHTVHTVHIYSYRSVCL